LSDCTIRESAIVAVHQRCGYVYAKYIHSDCQLGRGTGCLIDVDNPAVSSSLASLCVAAWQFHKRDKWHGAPLMPTSRSISSPECYLTKS